MMKLKFAFGGALSTRISHRIATSALCMAFILPSSAIAAITGTVYQDFNANGVQDTTGCAVASTGASAAVAGCVGLNPNVITNDRVTVAIDTALSGVTVTASCVTNRGADGVLGTADDTVAVTTGTTNATGAYSVADTGAVTPTGPENAQGKTACRVTFTWDKTTASLTNTTYDMSAVQYGNGATGTAVQFVNAGASAINLGLNRGCDYCQNNPNIVVPRFRYGNENGPSLVRFPYSYAGDQDGRANGAWTASTVANTSSGPSRATLDPIALAGNLDAAGAGAVSTTITGGVGTVYGLAYNERKDELYAGAFIRRKATQGTIDSTTGDSPGNIYLVRNANATPSAPVKFADLEALFSGSAGTNPHNRNTTNWQNDTAVRAITGKEGLGDIELSGDRSRLYVVALKDRKLYSLPTAVTPTAANTIAYTIPLTPASYPLDTGRTCVASDIRPFGLGRDKLDRIYVGVVCSAQSSAATVNDLYAFVWRLDTTTSAFTLVLRQSLNYSRNTGTFYGWQRWSDTIDNTLINPSPLLSDIVFDRNNDMILGFRDRFGDQVSADGAFVNASPFSRSVGETLLACNSSDTLWNVETAGGCGGRTGLTTGNWGPGGGSFFQGDLSGDAQDREAGQGALLILPGFREVMSTAFDPVSFDSNGQINNNFNTGGVQRYSLASGANSGNYLGAYDVFLDSALSFDKANGLGDIEALCSPAPIEVGNRLWYDTNANGIQDPGEAPVVGVQISLYAPGNTTAIATVITDSQGRYLFSSRATNAAGQALTDVTGVKYAVPFAYDTAGYQLRVDRASDYNAVARLNGYGLTIANQGSDDELDSDATLPGAGSPSATNPPTVTFNTGAPGQNVHAYDIGFVDRIDLSVAKAVTSAGPYIPGATVTYTLTARNAGPAAAKAEIVVKDQLPTGLTLSGASGTNWSCTPTSGGTTTTCTRATAAGALAANTNADVITVTATVNAGVASGTTLNNLAQVNPAAGEPRSEANPVGTANGGYETGDPAVGSNNDAGVTITSAAPPVYSIGDLVFNDANNNGVRDAGEAALAGATVQLFAAVGGAPTGAALGAAVTTDANGRYRFDGLAAGDYVVVVTPPAGYVSSTGTGTGSTGSNELDNGQDTRIAAGNPGAGGFRSGVITLSGTGAPTGELNNTSAVAAGGVSGAGGDAADNRSNRTVDFGFYQPFDLRMTKAISSSGTYVPGSTVTYTLTARNLGPGPAGAAIVVKDKLPTGLTAVSATGTNWTCTPQTGAAVEITCTRAAAAGALAANADADVITVTATVDAGVAAATSLSNKAQVNPSAADVAAGKTEVNPLGTVDGGYDDGSNATGSNNDDAKALTVAALNYSIGNRVWNDNGVGTGGVANDGLRNGTEPGIDGVTVELLSGTTVVGTTTTAGGGYYRFDNLAAGSYTVRITKPTGFVNTTVPATGSADNATDSDNNGATEAATTVTSPTIVLGPGDSEATNEADLVGGEAAGNAAANGGSDARGNMTVDFGLRAATLSLGNRVWNDVNNNGLIDSGETGINDVTVYLYADANIDGIPDGAPIATQTTVGGGYYLFTGLSAGNYVVGVDPSTMPTAAGLAPFKSSTGQNGSATGPNEGSALPDPNTNATDSDDNGTTTTALNAASATVPIVLSKSITLALDTEPAGESDVGPQANSASDTNTNLTVDFGFFRPASLGNFVWNDTNANGVQEGGEAGIQGVTVELYKNGVLVASTSTGVNGEYSFTNLIPGTDYTVDFVPVAGLIPSPQDQGGNDATDSDASPTTGLTAPITLNSGQTRDDIDAGFFSTAGLGDRVWYDNNRNGQQDAGELGVENVRVTLTTAAGGTVTDTTGATVVPQNTDANGNYFFANLPPGNYIVTFAPATLPAGYQFTTRGATGVKDGGDSDPNTTTGATETITLASGEADRTWDAGIFKREIDLILAKAQAPVAPATGSPWVPGNVVQYTVVVTNAGPDDTQSGWVVTDNLPAGLINPTLVSVTPSAAGSCSFSANTLTCNGLQGVRPATAIAGINNAALPASVSITYTAEIGPSASGSLVNSAQIAPNAADPAETIPLSATNTNNRSGTTLSLSGVASLGDRVWIDSNGNGTQDAGEPGVVGVTVTLFDGSGAQIATTTTGTNGVYNFANLTPNTPYTVSLNNPANFAVGGPLANFALIAPNAGGDDTIDSDATLVSGTPTISGATTGAPGSNTTTFDFGFVQLASLGNVVFRDTNGNGIQDAGEPGVQGVTVTVTDGSGAPVGTATTDINGNYTVSNLPPGTYTVTFSNLPAGLTPTTTNAPGSTPANDSNGLTSTVTLVAGQNDPTIDLGLVAPVVPPASVGNVVFRDTNGNGIQDAGEPGVQGVTATITRTDGTPVTDPNGNALPAAQTTLTTDVNGNYNFTNLGPGTYTVTFSNLPAGLTPTTTNAPGSTPANDSNGLTTTVTLVAGQNDPTIDLGLVAPVVPPASVGSLVFGDTNGNGIQDAGEPGVQGVTVTVTDGSGATVGTATTDVNGNYTVGGLPPGTYTVTFSNLPAGLTPTTTNAPGSTPANDSNGLTSTVTLVAGQNDPTIDLGLISTAPATGSVMGVVFLDPNRDGVKAPSEVGVPVGTVVNLVNPTTGAIVATTTTTDAAGNYTFPNVTPGNYNVVVPTPPGGTTATTPTTQPVTAVVGTTVRAPDIGFAPDAPVTGITGVVFIDPNRDGVKAPSEVGVPVGTVVNLVNPTTGAIVATTTTTDSAGNYTFPNVTPGNYNVVVPTPPGSTTATTPTTQPVTATVGAIARAPDIGFGPNTSGANVTGIVFFDPNRDGVLQTGEPPVVVGTVVELRDINGVLIATTTTGVNGSYTFPNVPPGTYTITVIPPVGTSATTPLVRTIVVGTTGTTLVPDVGVTATALPPAREIPTLSAFSLAALLLAMMGIVGGFQRRRSV